MAVESALVIVELVAVPLVFLVFLREPEKPLESLCEARVIALPWCR